MAKTKTNSSIFIFICFLLHFLPTAQSFIFNSFTSAQPNLTITGASGLITPSGVLQLTNSSANLTTRALYSTPFRLLSGNSSAVSFSTTFVFSILTAFRNGAGGFGLTFAIVPDSTLPVIPYIPSNFGLFSRQNDGNDSNHILAVEFDTIQAGENRDPNDNHIGLDINGMNTLNATTASYYDDTTKSQVEVQMESDASFQAWIEYDGVQKVINVTISPLFVPKPSKPLISRQIDLSPFFKPSMFVGFTSTTGKLASAHYILGWSFSLHKIARPLDLSRLPPRPTRISNSPQFKKTGIRVGAVSAAGTLVAIICVVLVLFLLFRRLKLRDVVDKWELDFPHRFKYIDLHAATKGFSKKRIIGKGGFGCVYRGILSKTKREIAVKKISHNSKQGLKEFVAEVATLGNLRHRHLVHLEGWCKRSTDMLLVYEFMSNGSLDTFLFDSRKSLGWSQRFRIIKEVAAGLVYLHHEWEQVVIHRDVKANNVLLDVNLTAKLGDFGLAKLHEHGENPATTHIVGTVGYISPELTLNGKATTSSDVYAFGALVFEVVCGRRPWDQNVPSQVLLQDWVWECYKMGHVARVADPKLGNQYVKSEMELVLKVGLLCSQDEAEARPSMRQVLRYLDGYDALPETFGVVRDGWKGGNYQPESVAHSYPPSSGGVMSTMSFSSTGR